MNFVRTLTKDQQQIQHLNLEKFNFFNFYNKYSFIQAI